MLYDSVFKLKISLLLDTIASDKLLEDESIKDKIDYEVGLVLNKKVGDYVNTGELIGYVGSTGKSTGPHVHFEVRVNGKTQDPTKYI